MSVVFNMISDNSTACSTEPSGDEDTPILQRNTNDGTDPFMLDGVLGLPDILHTRSTATNSCRSGDKIYYTILIPRTPRLCSIIVSDCPSVRH